MSRGSLILARINTWNPIFIHSLIFACIFFYILSSSANILLFHFFIDINLAKIGMLVTFLAFFPFTFYEIKKYLLTEKTITVFLLFWLFYLIINSYFSFFPGISFKFLLRIIGCWLIALQIAVLLFKHDGNYQNTIMYALLFSFLVITLIWNLHLRMPEALVWFKQKMTHKMDSRLTGLYINPNELGYALVIHSFVLFWFIKHRIYLTLSIIPLVFWGVYLSGSRNSFIALLIVSAFGIIYSLLEFSKKYKLKKKYSLLFILINFFISLILIKQYIPNRAGTTINQFLNQINVSNPSASVQKIYSSLGIRAQIYDFAIETWKNNQWVGIGIGSFSKHQNFGPGFNTHNFLLSILVGHGLIGIFFVSLFTLILILKMKSWTGSVVLMIFPLTLIFDDLSWSYIFPVYLSFLIGILFYYAIRNKFRKSETNNF